MPVGGVGSSGIEQTLMTLPAVTRHRTADKIGTSSLDTGSRREPLAREGARPYSVRCARVGVVEFVDEPSPRPVVGVVRVEEAVAAAGKFLLTVRL